MASAQDVENFLRQHGINDPGELLRRMVAMQQTVDQMTQQATDQNTEAQRVIAQQQALAAQLIAQMDTQRLAQTDLLARLQVAEQERADALKIAAAATAGLAGNGGGNSGGSDMLDSKGVGQPAKLATKQDDFAEWSHKFTTFVKVKCGKEVEDVLRWASQQKLTITKDHRGPREVAWMDEFGPQGARPIAGVERMNDILSIYATSFTTGVAAKIVRNSGPNAGIETWRRLCNEFDPTSATRRVYLLGQVQNPARCAKVEDLGAALENWLSQKTQYEQLTDRNGRPCEVGEDSLMAALMRLMPASLEETIMFQADQFDSFEAIFDKLASYAATKQSIQMTGKQKSNNNDMDTSALGASFAGTCNNCGKVGHKKADCRSPPKTGGDGCFNCGDPGHWSRDCGKGKGDSWKGKGGKSGKGGKGVGGWKGKGKGKKGKGKGVNAVDEVWPEDATWVDQSWNDDSWTEEAGQSAQWAGAQQADIRNAESAGQPEKEPGFGSLVDLGALIQFNTEAEDYIPSWERVKKFFAKTDDRTISCGTAIAAELCKPCCGSISGTHGDWGCPQGVLDQHLGGICSTEPARMGINSFTQKDPSYLVEWRGEKWLKVNYDSGAATSALPVEMALGDKTPVGEFVVADGKTIPNYGRYRLQAVDEERLSRGFAASVTTVHKPLGSASEFARTRDAMIYEDGGVLLPRRSPVALGMRKEYDRLVSLHGHCHALPLHREGRLYNLYVKPTGPLKKVDGNEAEAQLNAKTSTAASSSASGNSRQARP